MFYCCDTEVNLFYEAAPSASVEDLILGVSELEEQSAFVWERMLDEPGLWYARFELFRMLGPQRTIAAAYRRSRRQDGLDSKSVHNDWYKQARKWDWQNRAEAWDRVERERVRPVRY